jgi:hypothetical protein
MLKRQYGFEKETCVTTRRTIPWSLTASDVRIVSTALGVGLGVVDDVVVIVSSVRVKNTFVRSEDDDSRWWRFNLDHRVANTIGSKRNVDISVR